jgi:hypothetical protein
MLLGEERVRLKGLFDCESLRTRHSELYVLL